MTKNNKIYLYLASNLAFLVPVPGRFAYAFVMLVLFNLQMAVITMLFHAIHRMELASLRNSLLTLTIVSLAIFYKQILILVCPIIALTLGYCIFLPTLASVIIEFFFLDYEHGVKSHLAKNMKYSCFMSLFILFFFLVRDILGYGTFTFPGWKQLIVLHLPYNPSSTGAMVFLSTIPGSLCLVAVLLALYIYVDEKLHIFSLITAKGEK